jgi:RHS repeat-associated protein
LAVAVRTGYGGEIRTTDATFCPFRWPGQQEDPETGLYYNRFRYYDPQLGAYVSQDPIGLLGGLAPYRYVADPLRFADCYGLIEVDPRTINFSQRTVAKNVLRYTTDMKKGDWDWSRSGPLNVFDVDGQYVTYNNRRLMAAQNARLPLVPINVVDPRAPMPGAKTSWAEKLRERRHRKINVLDGQPVPERGLRQQPRVEC